MIVAAITVAMMALALTWDVFTGFEKKRLDLVTSIVERLVVLECIAMIRDCQPPERPP